MLLDNTTNQNDLLSNVFVDMDNQNELSNIHLWLEDVIDICRKVQPAEVLSGIVTRVGEFSMAQQVASEENIGFVEDVLRKFWMSLNNEPRILDFSVGVCHYESLNDNYAAGFINKSLMSNTGLS